MVDARIHLYIRKARKNRKKTIISKLCCNTANQGEILHRSIKQVKERPSDRGVIRRDIQLIETDGKEVYLLQSVSSVQRKTGIERDYTSDRPSTEATTQTQYSAPAIESEASEIPINGEQGMYYSRIRLTSHTITLDGFIRMRSQGRGKSFLRTSDLLKIVPQGSHSHAVQHRIRNYIERGGA